MDFEVRRGQIAIWIILAVVLVAAILLFLLLQRNIETDITPRGTEVNSFLALCLEPSVNEAKRIMLPRGGLLEKRNTVMFNFQEVEYLCVNNGFYDACINQHPLLLREMEDELEEYLNPRVNICFNELKDYIENGGEKFEFEQNYDVDVSIIPDDIVVNVNRGAEYRKKSGEESNYRDYRMEFASGAHGLATIALEIAAQEATYCYFESIGYSLYYPRYKVTRYQLSHPTKIYYINDTLTSEYMMIGIRSCAMPPGV